LNDQDGRSRQSIPWVLVSLASLTVTGVIALVIILTAGGEDATAHAQLIITFLSPTLVGLFLALQGQKTHNLVNSTAYELRDLAEKNARAEGRVEGIAQEASEPPRVIAYVQPPVIKPPTVNPSKEKP
jgi:hypothetical protein